MFTRGYDLSIPSLCLEKSPLQGRQMACHQACNIPNEDCDGCGCLEAAIKHEGSLPSGSYGKWPFIVDFSNENGDCL